MLPARSRWYASVPVPPTSNRQSPASETDWAEAFAAEAAKHREDRMAASIRSRDFLYNFMCTFLDWIVCGLGPKQVRRQGMIGVASEDPVQKLFCGRSLAQAKLRLRLQKERGRFLAGLDIVVE